MISVVQRIKFQFSERCFLPFFVLDYLLNYHKWVLSVGFPKSEDAFCGTAVVVVVVLEGAVYERLETWGRILSKALLL